MKSTSSQTYFYILQCPLFKSCNFKTLALKVGNELNKGTIDPSTRRAFSKIMYNIFLLSSKKIPFEQYYFSMFRDPPLQIVIPSQTTSFSLLIRLLTKAISFFYMQYKRLWTLLMQFLKVLASFKNWHRMTRRNTRPNILRQVLQPILKFSNMVYGNSFVIFFADFHHLSSTSPCNSFVIFFADFAHLSSTSSCRLPLHFSPVQSS